MLIDKREIERVKRANELAAFIRSRGVSLTPRGKQLVGLCPFHSETEASFFVDPGKQLWNCLGACGEGGDVYRFVMKADGVDFREAHLRLKAQAGVGSQESGARAFGSELKPEDQQWLERAVTHYHARLMETPAAQDYLRARGVTTAEIVTSFRIGYADDGVRTGSGSDRISSSLIDKLPAEGRRALRRIGVLTGSGRELLQRRPAPRSKEVWG